MFRKLNLNSCIFERINGLQIHLYWLYKFEFLNKIYIKKIINISDKEEHILYTHFQMVTVYQKPGLNVDLRYLIYQYKQLSDTVIKKIYISAHLNSIDANPNTIKLSNSVLVFLNKSDAEIYII